MADYTNEGALISTGGKGRIPSRFRRWGAPSNGAEAAGHKWTNYSSNFNAIRDHVCRPVIFGSDGKVTPVLFDFTRRHHHKDDVGANVGSPKQAAVGNGVYRDETGYWPTEYVVDHGRSSTGGFHGGVEATPEPTVITTGGWTRPSKAGWAMPPDVPLEKAANPRQMDTIVQSPVTVFHQPYASKPNKSSAVAVIDSREAAKKYGGKFTW